MLFGAVALTGVLAAVGMQTLTGPVTTITRVTQRNIADNHLLMDSKILINAAVTGTSGGDIDADGIIEPAEFVPAGGGETPPTNGGFLPDDLGLAQTDPWGTRYGYCVWDHGTSNSSTNRITGDNTATAPVQPVIAIIAAGPDKVFQTSCGAYSNGEVQVTKASGSDDIIQKYTYAEASASSNGLWTLSTSDDAKAELKPSNASTPVGVSINRETGVGDFLGITTSVLQAKLDDTIAVSGGFLLDGPAASTCGADQKGAIRLNTSETAIEICDGAGTWSQINTPPGGSAGHVQFNNGTGGFGGDANLFWDNITKRLGIGTATPSQALDVAGNTNVSGDLSAGGALTLTGAATLSGALSVAGNTTLGDATTDTVTIAGNTGIGGTLGVTGATMLSDVLTVAGDTILQDNLSVGGDTVLGDDASDTVSIAGNTGIGGILGVAGVTTLSSSLDVTGATTLSSTLSVAGNAAFDTNTLFVNALNNTVGIGTASPLARLDIAGGIKIGTHATCAAGGTNNGTIQYDNSIKKMQICVDGAWTSVSSIAQLDDIGDVEVPAPNNGDVLAWDDTASKWVSKNVAMLGPAYVDPAGNDGSVQFREGSDLAADTANLHWDDTNNRLGIGTTTPVTTLAVHGVVTVTASNGTGGLLQLNSPGGANRSNIYLRNNGLARWDIGADFSSETGADEGRFYINRFDDAGSYVDTVLLADRASGYIGLGTNTPASKLHVAGGIQLGNDTATCPGGSNVKLGTMRFTGTVLEVCLTSGWSGIGTGGSGTPGGANTQIQFNNAGTFDADSNLVWDNTNKRLGIGTTSPIGKFHVLDNGGDGRFYFDAANVSSGAALILRSARPGPAALQANDTLGAVGVRPYAGSGYLSAATSVIGFYAAENQTATAQGNFINFTTTPIGSTAALERIRISDNGNVGIGTTVPNAPLHLFRTNMGLQLLTGTNSSGYTADIGVNDDGVNLSNNSAVRGFNFKNANGTLLTVNPSGNVGIGTANPIGRLQIQSDTADTRGMGGALYLKSTGGANHYTSIGMDTDTAGATKSLVIHYGDHTGSAGNQLRFGRYGDSFGAWEANPYVFDMDAPEGTLVVAGSGNVGIGTTSPAAALDVNGQIVGGFGAATSGGTLDWNDVSNARAGSGYSLLYGNATNGPVAAGVYFHPFSFEYNSKNGAGNMTQLAIPYYTSSNSHGMFWRTRYSGTWSSWHKFITTDSAGNVGIGTTTPGAKLEVAGTVKADALAGGFDNSASGHVRLGNMQIAWGTSPAVTHSGTSGNVRYGMGTNTSFPAAFKAGTVPTVMCTADYAGDGVFGCVSATPTNAGFTPMVWASATGTSGTIRYIAIGVWQ